jgi:hypothetical protein
MRNNSKLPNLVIAGVNKAGTTSLFMSLKQHPDICASRIKETCYFLPLRYGTPLEPIGIYHQQFSHCVDARYIMEATPGYFYGGDIIATTIRKTLGNVRILIVLREPISRMFSFYKFQKSRLFIPREMTFKAYIRKCEQIPIAERGLQENNPFWGIEGGFYDDYLPAWQNLYGPDLKVLFFDDLVYNPQIFLRSTVDWLGLDGTYYEFTSPNTENQSTNYKSGQMQRMALWLNNFAEPFLRQNAGLKHLLRSVYYKLNGQSFKETISPDARTYLEGVFLPHNQRLSKQLVTIGYKDLPNWLRFPPS